MSDNRNQLSASTTAVHAAVSDIGVVEESGNPLAVQLQITTGKTATVELYGRVSPAANWVKFATVALDDTGFLKSYDGVPYIAWKVTAIDASAAVTVWVGFDD